MRAKNCTRITSPFFSMFAADSYGFYRDCPKKHHYGKESFGSFPIMADVYTKHGRGTPCLAYVQANNSPGYASSRSSAFSPQSFTTAKMTFIDKRSTLRASTPVLFCTRSFGFVDLFNCHSSTSFCCVLK